MFSSQNLPTSPSFPQTNKGNRWYDDHPKLTKAIDLLEMMPQQHRLILCRCVNDYTEENKLLGTTEELKSLGHERVLGLIQSKARRRWYDQDTIVHRAVNNLLLMANRDRENVAYRMVVAQQSIAAYTELCQRDLKLVDPQEIEQIVDDIFRRSLEELLDILESAVPEDESLAVSRFTPDTESEVVDEEGGMKLSALFGSDEDSY